MIVAYFPSNIGKETLRKALNLVFTSKLLTDSLADWWRHKGKLPPNEADMGFCDWVCNKIDKISDCIGARAEDPPVNEIVEALRVNAIGDPMALNTIDPSKEEGFKTDTNCYVEDCIVYSSVWLTGLGADEVYDRAKAIAKEFEAQGYATDIYVDEEDDTEVTVNASIDFPVYMENFRQNLANRSGGVL